jgi:hypothetical protein
MNSQTDLADGPTDAAEELRRQTEICPLLIASTAHVTVGEAQALTDHGYSRGECGWLFFVGQPGDPVLSEIEPVSAGLAEVIRRARKEGCPYVLLDRDAGILPDVPTYDW